MKKTLTLMALSAILIPAAVMASNHYEKKTEHRLERMSTELQLSEQQRVEVRKLFTEQKEKKQVQRKQMRAETEARLSQVLSEEQLAKWQQHRQDRIKSCRHHGKGKYSRHHEYGEYGEYGKKPYRDDDD